MNRRAWLVVGVVVGWFILGGCGAAPGASAERPRGLDDPEHRRVAEAIISTFENSTTELPYAEAHRLGDGRGITAGRAGFTSGTHDLLLVVQRYERDAGGSTPLSRYLPALRAIDTRVQDGGDGDSTTGLDDFEATWRSTSRSDPRLNHAQDAVYDELYFRPARDQARRLGVTSALGQLVLLDTGVQHGTGTDPDGMGTIVAQTQAQMQAQMQAGHGVPADDPRWLRQFLDIRRAHLEHPADSATTEVWRESIPRVDTLETLLDQQRFDLATPLAWTFAGSRFSLPA